MKSIARGSAADLCQKIEVDDQIIEVDGRPLGGYSNHEAVEMLRNTGKVVKLRLARYLRGSKYEKLQQAISEAEMEPPLVVEKSPLKTSRYYGESKDDNSLDNYASSDTSKLPYTPPLSKTIEQAIIDKWSAILSPNYEVLVS